MPKKFIAVRLNGKPFDGIATPRVIRIITEFLSKAPEGELFTTEKLAKRLRFSEKNFSTHVGRNARPQLNGFRIKVRFPKSMCVWGSERTIKEVLKNKEILA